VNNVLKVIISKVKVTKRSRAKAYV